MVSCPQETVKTPWGGFKIFPVRELTGLACISTTGRAPGAGDRPPNIPARRRMTPAAKQKQNSVTNCGIG